jgi:hypothetical protein
MFGPEFETVLRGSSFTQPEAKGVRARQRLVSRSRGGPWRSVFPLPSAANHAPTAGKDEKNNFSGRFSDAGPELSGSNHPNRLPKNLRRPSHGSGKIRFGQTLGGYSRKWVWWRTGKPQPSHLNRPSPNPGRFCAPAASTDGAIARDSRLIGSSNYGVSAVGIYQQSHHFVERWNVELCNRSSAFQRISD